MLAIGLANLAMDHRLYHQANHDWLSGLPNRTRLHDEFAAWCADTHGKPLIGMLQIGLDRFKQINDSAGHAAGDLLLAKVGHRLRAAMDGRVMLSRFAGDQFVLMTAGLDPGDLLASLNGLAEQISVELDRPIAIGHVTCA